MNKSTKLIMTGAASLLGVALAAGGAYATGNALSTTDAPGQVMQLQGIGPASAHASDNAKTHANENARGLFGISSDTEADTDTTTETDTTKSDTSANSTSSTEASVPREAAKNASTVKGNETGMTVKEWAQTKNDVEVVAPDEAVSVTPDATVNAEVKATVREDGDR
jgi:hypothetical protein